MQRYYLMESHRSFPRPMLSNTQQCSVMLSNAQQCSAMLSNELQRDSKRIVMLIMLNIFFKKLISSPPSPPPNQRIRGAPRSLGGAPKNHFKFRILLTTSHIKQKYFCYWLWVINSMTLIYLLLLCYSIELFKKCGI